MKIEYTEKFSMTMDEFEDVVEEYGNTGSYGLIDRLIGVAADLIDMGAQVERLKVHELAAGLNETAENLLDILRELIGCGCRETRTTTRTRSRSWKPTTKSSKSFALSDESRASWSRSASCPNGSRNWKAGWPGSKAHGRSWPACPRTCSAAGKKTLPSWNRRGARRAGWSGTEHVDSRVTTPALRATPPVSGGEL